MASRDHDHDTDQHDLGLAHDLQTLIARQRVGLMSRRNAMKVFGGASVGLLVACGSKATKAATSAASTTSAASAAGASPASTIPQETAGPFPGDGTNGANALTQSGIVRSDITTSLGTGTKAPGVPMTVKLKLLKGVGGAAFAGAAVYLWHCDQTGRYSMYSSGVTGETWLRGVQTADANGEVTFTTIYPGCYDGRWPHMHFEVYPTLASATTGKAAIATSQLAMTEATAKQTYAATGYTASVANLAKTSLARDMVFSDGADLETPAFTGDVSKGFAATLTVAVKG